MNRGKALRLVVLVYAMMDAIRRIFVLLFGHPQPIEWWLLATDLAIVALIVWLDVPERLHKRRIRQRMGRLVEFLNEGQKLLTTFPDDKTSYGQTLIPGWKTAVENWITSTNSFLLVCSPYASAKFLDDSQLSQPRDYFIPSININTDLWKHLEMVHRRLSNLQEIVQSQQVYIA